MTIIRMPERRRKTCEHCSRIFRPRDPAHKYCIDCWRCGGVVQGGAEVSGGNAHVVVEKVVAENITVGARLRAVDPEKVKTFAESMKTIGMVTPISVWSTEDG